MVKKLLIALQLGKVISGAILGDRKDKEHLQSAGFIRKCVEVRTGNKSYFCWRIISENFSWTRHKVNFKK